MSAFCLVLGRELRIALRRKGDVLNVLAFFIVVAALFPLGVGPEPNQLRAMASGVMWVGALLAALLSLPRLFAYDHADGTLEQLAAGAQPLALVVWAKVAAHWLTTGLPLALLAPLLGLQYGLPGDALATLFASLLIGTPVLSLIGAAGAALALGARGAGALLALLVLPLYVPALVFGAGAVTANLSGINSTAYLALLGAFLAVSSVAGPWAACAALRVALD
jgi:heme exporter protein B